MGKSKETLFVLEEISKSDIISRRQEIWLRKVWVWLVPLLMVWLVGLIYVLNMMDVSWQIEATIAIVGYLLLVIPLCFKLNRVGNQYWDEVKDKEQPIELETMPSWFWWRNKKREGE